MADAVPRDAVATGAAAAAVASAALEPVTWLCDATVWRCVGLFGAGICERVRKQAALEAGQQARKADALARIEERCLTETDDGDAAGGTDADDSSGAL